MEREPSSRRDFLRVSTAGASTAILLAGCGGKLAAWLRNATSEGIKGLEELPLRERLVQSTVCLVYSDITAIRERRRGAGIFLGQHKGRFVFVGPAHLKPPHFHSDQVIYEALATNAKFLDVRENPLPGDYETDDFMILESSDSEGNNLPPITSLPTERYFHETLLPFLQAETAELSLVVLDVVDRHGSFTPRDMYLRSTRLREPPRDTNSQVGGPGRTSYGSMRITRDILYPGVSGSPIFLMGLQDGKPNLLVDYFGKPIILGIVGGKPKEGGAMYLTWSSRIVQGAEWLGYHDLDYSSGQPQWLSNK